LIGYSPVRRKLISSASPYEREIGFSRAVRVGNVIAVSGTAPIADDGSTACPNDAGGQTRRCLEIIKAAVDQAGGSLEDIVRTRIYLTDASRWEEVGRVHGEFFGDIRPAATMVEVNGLVRDDWLVEIEADAVITA
jgi:enamine deaminase RidA (YjgF/YER057c/UK114 family)